MATGQYIATPAVVRQSGEEYRQGQDVVEQFIEKWCDTGEDLKDDFSALYDTYKMECVNQHVKAPVSKTAFGLRLDQLKYKLHCGTGGKRMRLGLQLKGKRTGDG